MDRELTPELMKKLDCRYCAHWHSNLTFRDRGYYICSWNHCEALECGYDATKLYPADEFFDHGDTDEFSIGTRQMEYGKRVMSLLLAHD